MDLLLVFQWHKFSVVPINSLTLLKLPILNLVKPVFSKQYPESKAMCFFLTDKDISWSVFILKPCKPKKDKQKRSCVTHMQNVRPQIPKINLKKQNNNTQTLCIMRDQKTKTKYQKRKINQSTDKSMPATPISSQSSCKLTLVSRFVMNFGRPWHMTYRTIVYKKHSKNRPIKSLLNLGARNFFGTI